MIKSEPLISVIIPIYNVEAYLARCLDSVLNNTYRKLEVICVDDGSTDSSAEILCAYAEKDSRIVPIFKENGGVSSARNAGLDRMTGDFVTFIDSDDFVHPQYVELLLAAQRLSAADIVIGGFKQTNSIEVISDYSYYTVGVQDICVIKACDASQKTNATMGIFSRLISSEAVGKHRFCSSFSYGEDTLFALELYVDQPSMQVGFISLEIYYYYRGRSDSLVNTRRDKDILRYLRILGENATAKQKEHVYLETMIRRGLYFRYYYIFIQKEPELDREIGKILRQEIKQLLRSQSFGLRFKAARTLFILFPRLDRAYRFYRDPSLKRYEQIQKAEIAEKQVGFQLQNKRG